MKKSYNKIVATGDNAAASLLRFFLFLCTPPGIAMILKSATKKLRATGIFGNNRINYEKWCEAEERKRAESRKNAVIKIKDPAHYPLITVVVFADKPTEDVLNDSLASVVSQTYERWKIVIIGSSGNALPEVTAPYHDRISFIPNLQEITTDFLLFLPAGDTLASETLTDIGELVALKIQLKSKDQPQLIYFDEDRLGADGRLREPCFKPDFSPDALLCRNYIGECFCISSELYARLGLSGGELSSRTLYDLLLRSAEVEKFIHRPYVLVHRKEASGYTDAEVSAAAMSRRKTLEVNAHPSLVSILIPTRDQAELLRQALESIFERTAYKEFEVLILNNNSIDPAFFELCDEFAKRYGDRFRVIEAAYTFNFSRLMNQGASEAKGEYLLMLNNDIEVIEPEWLTRMLHFAMLPHIGAVGAKLLYPDGTIQHAGIALGGDTTTKHLFVHEQANATVHDNYLNFHNNVTAVTAACLLCRKEALLKVNGMDEKLDVEYNDVDLCQRFRLYGFYNVWLHDVVLIHHESASRGHPFRSLSSWRKHNANHTQFRQVWDEFRMLHDVYWNPANDLPFE